MSKTRSYTVDITVTATLVLDDETVQSATTFINDNELSKEGKAILKNLGIDKVDDTNFDIFFAVNAGSAIRNNIKDHLLGDYKDDLSKVHVRAKVTPKASTVSEGKDDE